tara:strand:- start:1141 stop:1419 length:279 start_codon:yes stop_codon:yes gene_type:complete
MSAADAAKSGDRRKTLEAMRDKLAEDFDAAPPAVVAQIAGRLSAILAELDALPAETRSTLDELASRRSDRIAAATAEPASRKQTRQRRTGSD